VVASLAERDITVRVKAEIGAYKAGMEEAAKAARKVSGETEAAGKAAGAAGKSLDNAGKSALGTGRQLDNAGTTMAGAGQKAESSWAKLGNTIQKNEQSIKTVGTGLTVLGGAVTGIGAAALHTGMQYNTLQQTTRAALTTITGSAAEANAQMDQLDAFAKNSPFAKDVFIRAQQQLLGFGMEATRVIPTLDAIQDAVAATGGSSQDILEIANVLAKVQGTGKITAETLNELGIRGVDAATIIGEQMGQTGDEIRAGITKGTVGADSALQALTDGMKTRFDGAAAGVKETFAGAIDRVKAAWRDLSAEMA